jgi:hypothetical protein
MFINQHEHKALMISLDQDTPLDQPIYAKPNGDRLEPLQANSTTGFPKGP